MEQRGYGSYHYLISQANESIADKLIMDFKMTGTKHGLSKMPYLRDTRRSLGIKQFKMTHYAMTNTTLSIFIFFYVFCCN